MNTIVRLFKSTPELTLVTLLTVLGYTSIALLAEIPSTGELSGGDVITILIASFIFSTLIAIVAVVGGVGGGVLFTPIMLAFTSIDTLVIRSTGLVVAMFSGLVSSGPFMRNGLANIRLVYFGSVPIIIGAISGALSAVVLADSLGETGDALVRFLLGVILVFIAVMFITGGSKTEFPEPKSVDEASKKMGLSGSYWEASLGKVVHFQATKGIPGWILLLAVGFTGGFFG
ncbi:MAG: TSUP family transporter, partial [Gammaproteobacteria bacterium]